MAQLGNHLYGYRDRNPLVDIDEQSAHPLVESMPKGLRTLLVNLSYCLDRASRQHKTICKMLPSWVTALDAYQHSSGSSTETSYLHMAEDRSFKDSWISCNLLHRPPRVNRKHGRTKHRPRKPTITATAQKTNIQQAYHTRRTRINHQQ